MEQLLHFMGQRRVWAAVVSVAMFAMGVFGVVTSDLDAVTLTDLLTKLGEALANLIVAALALWSYVAPKLKK